MQVPDNGDVIYEWTSSDDVQYHVISVQNFFSSNNPTLIQNYCCDDIGRRKKKILVIVDDYVGNAIADIEAHFKSHSSAIDQFCILSFHVSNECKIINSVQRVIDAAIGLMMSPRNLFVINEGETPVDIIGIAAAIYKGSIPHVRIPTTLLGTIDSGMEVKVEINFEERKNFLGRFFAPVACLNDPAPFYPTLPQRDFACELAEWIKIAVVKSPRLFDVIERHHHKAKYNTYTHELIQIFVQDMLEELQPNLEKTNLRPIVDFEHESGHIGVPDPP